MQNFRLHYVKAFPVIANLADKADGGKVTVSIEGASSEGSTFACLRNAVEDPLDEAGVQQIPPEDDLSSRNAEEGLKGVVGSTDERTGWKKAGLTLPCNSTMTSL